ncbi:MAG: flagellar basal body-associated FliL family protein [Fimbriimonadaceae bacterium]|nr:flagellar basal body-associated FliL family protein [Fimbriimonadaceae bacterium]
MSEEAADQPKKKGKLPVILVAVVVLAGGGYFMMGGKKKPTAPPAVMLGETKMDLGEFTAQLTDGHTYLKVQVVVQLKKDFKVEGEGEGHGGGKGGDPVMRNAVQMVLAETKPEDIATADGIATLKEKIAWKLNHEIELQEKAEKIAKGEAVPEEKSKKKKKKGEEEAAPEEEKFERTPLDEREHPEWQSDEGPVLMVFFPSFLPAKY